MRTNATPNERSDPLRAWTLERERFHRARALRLLLPGLAPLLVIGLLFFEVIEPPSGWAEWALWVVTGAIYAVFWIYLIRDARRFVQEATAVDQQYRTQRDVVGDRPVGSEVGAVAAEWPAEPAAGPVLALAGRRIDARDASAERFPLGNVGDVRERLDEYIAAVKPGAVVCSAACGADLLALDAAESQGVKRRVILPFDRVRFRQSSVTDRPGTWGPLYDRVLDSLDPQDLVVLPFASEDDAAYEATNQAILDEAAALAGRGDGADAAPVVAVIVWDGQPRGVGDLTAGFRAEAERRGIPVVEIPTLGADRDR